MTGYVTTREAGELLSLTDARIRQLIIAGDLPAQRVGKFVLLIPTSAIAKLKKKRINGNGKRKAA